MTTEAGRRLVADIREMAQVIHQTDSLRSHADPNDKTGWNLGPIETCEDPYCIDGRDASGAIAAIEAEAAANMLATVTSSAAEIAATERAALLAELEAGVEGLEWPDASHLGRNGYYHSNQPMVRRAAVLDLIRKAGKR